MRLVSTYHLVTQSPWPIISSINILSIILNSLYYLYSSNPINIISIHWIGWRLILLSITLFFWFFDIFLENLSGSHSKEVNYGIYLGLFLFIISEFLIFFSLFFSYFYNSLLPDPSIGCLWPPLGISPLDYLSIPLFNTILLISSGFSLTLSHHLISSLSYKSFFTSILYLLISILLGLTFSYFQYFEYNYSPFTLSDSIFSSSFYLLTGWHGIHVLLGTLFLFFSLLQLLYSLLSSSQSKFFLFSSLYWHFVDLIWLFLFFFLYFLIS